jgi:hypothetical protein
MVEVKINSLVINLLIMENIVQSSVDYDGALSSKKGSRSIRNVPFFRHFDD